MQKSNRGTPKTTQNNKGQNANRGARQKTGAGIAGLMICKKGRGSEMD